MTRTATTLLILSLTLPGAATADHFGRQTQPDIYGLTAAIRSQLTIVQANARQTLRFSDEYDDVCDELEELCEDLSRFEQTLDRAAYSRHARGRLPKYAERVDEQVCEVIEEIEDALEDCRHDRRRGHRHAANAPRVVPAQAFYSVPSYPAPTIRLGRVTLSFGSQDARVAHATQTLISSPQPYPTQHPTQFHNPGAHYGPNPLMAEAQALRSLTRQLRSVLCD